MIREINWNLTELATDIRKFGKRRRESTYIARMRKV